MGISLTIVHLAVLHVGLAVCRQAASGEPQSDTQSLSATELHNAGVKVPGQRRLPKRRSIFSCGFAEVGARPGDGPVEHCLNPGELVSGVRRAGAVFRCNFGLQAGSRYPGARSGKGSCRPRLCAESAWRVLPAVG